MPLTLGIVRRLLLCLFLTYFSLLLISSSAACGQNKQHVFILHSYHKGLTWTDNESEGIESTLRSSNLELELHTEYLDSKRFDVLEQRNTLATYFQAKYAAVHFDVILCSDDDALNFVLEYREVLFPGVPVVFCGVNFFKESDWGDRRNEMTGVVEAFDLPSTLSVALNLHPATSKIVIINDLTTTGKANRKILDQVLPQFAEKVSFEFLDDLDMPDLLERINTLPSDTLLLLLTFNRDHSGQVFDYDQSIALISQAAPVPIYGVWDFYLGHGIVGGMLTSGRDQGRVASEMALRILNGEAPSNMPIVTKSPNRFMFDFRQLNRFGLSPAELPAGAMVINQPPPFHKVHPLLMKAILATLIGLIMIILLLLIRIRLRRQAELALKRSEERFRGLYVNNPAMYFTVNQEYQITSVNPYGAEQLGYATEELVGMPVFTLFVHEDQEKAKEYLTFCITNPGQVVHGELRKIHKDGRQIWVRESARGIPCETDNELTILIVCEDISDRKEAERILAQEKEHLSVTLRSIGDGVISTDPDGVVLFLNNAAEELTGWAQIEAVGKPLSQIFAIFDENTGEICANPVAEVIQTGMVVGLANHTKLIAKDGTERLIADSGAPIRDDQGVIFGVIIVFRDVTEQKRAEKAISESEAKYRAIFEHSGTGMMFIEEDKTISLCNKMFEDLSGYAKSEVEGRKKWEEFVATPKDLHRMQVFHVLRRRDPRLVPSSYEFQFVDRQANVKDMVLSIALMPDNRQTLGVLIDITERKQAEIEHLRLVTAIEQSEEAILITDTDWNMSYANPAFERLSGLNRDEILGRNISNLEYAKLDKAFFDVIRQNLEAGTIWKGRFGYMRKDGSQCAVEGTASPVRNSDGTLINYVFHQRDVTNESKLEKQLRQAQKMEAIGTLAGGIAHDFNNILTAIIGYCQIAYAKAGDDSPVRRNLDHVLSASKRASDLVRQILTFSRKTEQERMLIQITPIVKEVMKLLRASLPSTIDIRHELAIPQGRGIILADPTQIHQILMNLCTNAAQSMQPSGGVLKVSLANMEADAALVARYRGLRLGHYVQLTVSDTGHGMSPEVMERIFEPYFTTKDLGEGTGLGLAVVQGIVNSHGGIITVYSEPGKGTRFTVFLPEVLAEITTETDENVALPTGREHILVVDDEQELVNLSATMLELLGYQVTATSSSLDALAIFKAEPDKFDLVITDMTMPELTGRELAQELLAVRENVPIVMCSGFSEVFGKQQAQEEGIREFIVKPYGIATLANVVREVLDVVITISY